MIDVKLRNKQVKKILAGLFGRENVSVLNGRGTAWGWCEISINAGKRLDNTETYSQREKDLMNDIHDKADKAIKDIEFYSYTSDMGSDHKEVLIQVSLR